jgi:hypothetical protein
MSPEEQMWARAFPDEFAKQRFAKPTESWGEPYQIDVGGKPVMVQKSSTTGQLRSVGSGGVTVNMGETQKPVGADATKYVFQDGSVPLPTETIESIVSKGGRLVTPGEQNAQQRTGTIVADKEELQAKLAEAESGYAAAKAKFDQNPMDPQAVRELYNAAATLKTAKAGYENWRGEPSEGVAGRFSVPGPVGVMAEKILSPLFESQIARPTTDAEYDALPQGATYIDPDDGKTYRKP